MVTINIIHFLNLTKIHFDCRLLKDMTPDFDKIAAACCFRAAQIIADFAASIEGDMVD